MPENYFLVIFSFRQYWHATHQTTLKFPPQKKIALENAQKKFLAIFSFRQATHQTTLTTKENCFGKCKKKRFFVISSLRQATHQTPLKFPPQNVSALENAKQLVSCHF